MTKGTNEILDQVMGQRPGRFDTLLFERNGGGLRLADPDGQIAIAVRLAQEQYRLILRLLYAYANHTNFTHQCLPSACP
ncbi:hypothetical protein MCHIJ_37550 [Mycolicibacterium chitae]|nr:hypothetical protein MCHIJ_37550 [Mycolicibacterium chitae]